MAEIPVEFRSAARKFTQQHLPFLDRNWLYDFLERQLGELLHQTVKEHTSATTNTALRDAAKAVVELAEHTLIHLPYEVRKCRCRELDDGDHKPQPICHYCSIGRMKSLAKTALETP